MGNIYVGNLSYSVTDDSLEELFATYGTVSSAKVITDRFTGRSKGFGFVEMSSDEETEKAIETLNGSEHDGRTLKVAPGRPPRRRNRNNYRRDNY